MDLRSKLGFREGPFQDDPTNKIKSGQISMKGVNFPLIGTDGKKAVTMRPGGSYSYGGEVTETTPQDMMDMEPQLVEAHLSTLSLKDKKIFMDRYEQITDEAMKMEVVKQMFAKHYSKIAPTTVAQDGVLVDDRMNPSYREVNKRPYLAIEDYERAGFTYMGTAINSPNKDNTVDMARFQQGPESDPNWDGKRIAPSGARRTKQDQKAQPVEQQTTSQIKPQGTTVRPTVKPTSKSDKYGSVSDAELLDNFVGKQGSLVSDRELMAEIDRRGLTGRLLGRNPQEVGADLPQYQPGVAKGQYQQAQRDYVTQRPSQQATPPWIPKNLPGQNLSSAVVDSFSGRTPLPTTPTSVLMKNPSKEIQVDVAETLPLLMPGQKYSNKFGLFQPAPGFEPIPENEQRWTRPSKGGVPGIIPIEDDRWGQKGLHFNKNTRQFGIKKGVSFTPVSDSEVKKKLPNVYKDLKGR
jgi:hypothetical protein